MNIEFSQSYINSLEDGDHFVMAYYKTLYTNPYTNLNYTIVDYLLDSIDKEKPFGLTTVVEDEFYNMVSSATKYYKDYLEYIDYFEKDFVYDKLGNAEKVQAVFTAFREIGYDVSLLSDEVYDNLFSKVFDIINN